MKNILQIIKSNFTFKILLVSILLSTILLIVLFDNVWGWLVLIIEALLLILFLSNLSTELLEKKKIEASFEKIMTELKEETFRVITREGYGGSILGKYTDTGNIVLRNTDNDISRREDIEMYLISDRDSDDSHAPFYGFGNVGQLVLVTPGEVESFNRVGKRIVATTNEKLLSRKPQIIDRIETTFLRAWVEEYNNGNFQIRITKSDYSNS